MEQITVGNTEIKYTIQRSNRKTIGLIVDPENGVIIRSPQKLSREKIKDVVKKKSPWLIEKLGEVEKIKPKPRAKEFLSGEKLPYLGRRYRLKVTQNEEIKKPDIKLYQGKFHIETPSNLTGSKKIEELKKGMTQWYRDHAEEKIKERVANYQEQLGVEINRIRIKEQKKRWGSCSSKKNLNFNWRLIMAPISVIDYIVVHELTHLIHPNHSKEFWKTVETIIPDYREKQEWLKINGPTLDF